MSDLFQWKFSSDTLSRSLANCVSLPIEVQPFNATNTTGSRGVPPYYMHAFAIDGIPTTTLIGTDNQTLSWMPTHPPGTKLVLKVVDSVGTSGGVSPNVYTVIAGQSTQCVVDDTTTNFTVSANIKDELTTCEPWQLKMAGGVPPYNITFAALNSPVVTNVTMPFGDDVFVYINRADPGTQLIAGDYSTGRWAKGTPIVNTKGSTDVSCTGKTSFSTNSTTLDSQNSHSGSSNRIAIIVGVCVPILLVIIAAAVFIPWYRRRRQREYHLVELIPRRFEDPNPKYNESYRQPPSSSTNVNDEIVVQHRDGGTVHELPPPYADRTINTPA